jgi:hypothetical protein
MHRWLDGAMKAMREALANEPEMREAQARQGAASSEAAQENLVRAVKGGR